MSWCMLRHIMTQISMTCDILWHKKFLYHGSTTIMVTHWHYWKQGMPYSYLSTKTTIGTVEGADSLIEANVQFDEGLQQTFVTVKLAYLANRLVAKRNKSEYIHQPVTLWFWQTNYTKNWYHHQHNCHTN